MHTGLEQLHELIEESLAFCEIRYNKWSKRSSAVTKRRAIKIFYKNILLTFFNIVIKWPLY